MNPLDSPQQASPDLPHIGVENAGAQVPTEVTAVQRAEIASKQAELPQVGGVVPDPLATAMPAGIPAVPPPVPVDPAQDQQLSQYAPAIAEDNDLIEPEWVERARKIVDDTHDDPHKQNVEVNRLKADYIKKRYKKDIKVAEG